MKLKFIALICHIRNFLIKGISLYLCSAGGKFCNHSIEEFKWLEKILTLLEIILSQIIIIKKIILIKDKVDPIDETIFQEV